MGITSGYYTWGVTSLNLWTTSKSAVTRFCQEKERGCPGAAWQVDGRELGTRLDCRTAVHIIWHKHFNKCYYIQVTIRECVWPMAPHQLLFPGSAKAPWTKMLILMNLWNCVKLCYQSMLKWSSVKFNQLPDNIEEKKLADKFVDFFMNKLINIRDKLKDDQKYSSDKISTKLHELSPLGFVWWSAENHIEHEGDNLCYWSSIKQTHKKNTVSV